MTSDIQEEIAKELTLALIGKVMVGTNPSEAAKHVGEMYKIILNAVKEAKN